MGKRPANHARLQALVGISVCLTVGMVVPAASEARGRDRDRDGDGLTNRYELRRSHTNPRRADTDRDGLKDRYELRRSHTNPRRPDTDRDGLKDGYEVRRSQTNPRRPDSDGDGMTDALEVMLGRDPLTSNSSGGAPPPAPPLDDAPAKPDQGDPPRPLPDLLAPDTSLDSGPSGTVASAEASFSFRSSESGSTFECRLDGGALGGCSSPKAYAGLANGSHTFSVRATDAADNADPSPASRSWTVTVAKPPAGSNCMPNPTSCGFPDVSTTGVPAGTTLTPVRGTVTLSTPGQVYENKLLTGSITVTAPNVTIRNVKLVATDDWYGIRAFGWEHDTSGLLVDHVEIDLNGTTTLKGIAFDGYTARHVFFHNGSDCAHMGSHVTIEDSLCVVGPDANDDGWPDSTSFCNGPDHFDGFQSDGGDDITIRHNTIRNPCDQTSGILMSSNTDGIGNVRIENNLMAGGGYTLYCNAGPDVQNETVTGNRFSKRFYSTGGYWGPTTGCDDADVFSGNVWDETGASL